MLDKTLLRDDAEHVAGLLSGRGYQLDVGRFHVLDEAQRECARAVQDLQTQRRAQAKEFEALVRQGKSPDEARAELGSVADAGGHEDKLKRANEALRAANEQLNAFMLEIPNIPHTEAPKGESEADNKQLGLSQMKPPKFGFEFKDHVALAGVSLDAELAANLAGARFMVLRGTLARLHRALTQFMLDMNGKAGYEEVYVPYIANAASMRGTGQLPKVGEDLFALKDNDWYLIPTGEVPLTNLYADRILEQEELEQPIRLMAHTPCFRREAGNYGRDTHGVLRQHQFDKVELVHICMPEHSNNAFDGLNAQVAAVLTALELPYREVALCTGDLGFAATRTIDYEVWFPSQDQYREVSSCSHFGDFQARRMGLRWRDKSTKKIGFAHTLNGSGVAVGRCMAALLENHQQADGSVLLPKVLAAYMGGTRELQLGN
jgi:seryl-tRNA synthetase